MNAPNLVYATVVGMYPRLLADDGVHEALMLPYDLDTRVPFQFFREGSTTPLPLASITTARYIRPDGVIVSLSPGLPPFIIEFPANLIAGGVCLLTIESEETLYQCYPFRVLRPSEVLTP